ncbi:MAG: ComF family protein [Verrucomicrobiales bacterium]|nr:ComF family protein [Verrucomicrobiales bacterium]
MPHRIEGNWNKGLAYDLHTLSSSFLGTDAYGHEQWENTRSEMGELVYQLKYQENREAVNAILSLLDRIKGIETFDLIVPIPATDRSRTYQPVRLIAEALGAKHGVDVASDLLVKLESPPLKNVESPGEREHLLRESMALTHVRDVTGAKVLLVDDVFRSGATLNAATNLLFDHGRVRYVGALTMTKTRSNR